MKLSPMSLGLSTLHLLSWIFWSQVGGSKVSERAGKLQGLNVIFRSLILNSTCWARTFKVDHVKWNAIIFVLFS